MSDQPLFSPWNTQFYRLFGPGYPADGQPFNRQVIKSAFELDFGATVEAGHTIRLTGRSWSAGGPIRHVDVSTDGGQRWRRARPIGSSPAGAWQRWELDWRPETGEYELLARAGDVHGHVQPDVTRYNTLGYLFDAVVRHPSPLSAPDPRGTDGPDPGQRPGGRRHITLPPMRPTIAPKPILYMVEHASIAGFTCSESLPKTARMTLSASEMTVKAATVQKTSVNRGSDRSCRSWARGCSPVRAHPIAPRFDRLTHRTRGGA